MKRGIFIPYRRIAVALVGLAAIFWSVSNITAQPPIPHAVPPGIDMDCLSCHQAGVAEAPRLAWDHLGRSNDDCQQCHAISGNFSVPIPHDIEGQEECHDCHLDGSAGAPRVAGVHASYTVDTCQTCHPPMRIVAPEVQQAEGQEKVTAEVGEDAGEDVEAVEAEVEVVSPPHTDPGCQKCHWQMAQEETHQGVAAAEMLPADQGAALFADHCAGCHGEDGQDEAYSAEVLALKTLLDDPEADVDEEALEEMMADQGVVLNDAAYLSSQDDARVMQAIIGIDRENEQHVFAETYGGPLTWADVAAVAAYIRTWDEIGPPQPQPAGGRVPNYAEDVLPIFAESCAGNCHLDKQRGDWSIENYETVMTSGKNAPVIIPGDPDNSLLAQKLQDRQDIGKQMPLKELLPPDQIDLILEWIRAGAPNN